MREIDIDRIISVVRETDSIFFDGALRSDVRMKGDCDYVTLADIGISEYLQKRLWEEFPGIGFISEEGEKKTSPERDYWILDPIDGTANFMHGLAFCGVSLGLYSEGKMTAGVIYIPYTGELFHGVLGQGAYLNGKPIHCSRAAELSECIGFYEFNAYFKNRCDEAMEYAEKIYLGCQDIRCLGSSAVELAYIACGRADLFLGRCLKPWDFAAASVIIKEAGGELGCVDGELDMTRLNQHIIAAAGGVYSKFESILRAPGGKDGR